MPDGSITFSTALDNKQMEKDLAGLEKKIAAQERSISDLRANLKQTKESSVLSSAELDAEKAKLQALKDKLTELKAAAADKSLSPAIRAQAKAQLPGARDEVSEQQERVRLLQGEYNKLENAASRYAEELKRAEEVLARNQEEAGQLVEELNQAVPSGGGSVNRTLEEVGSRVNKLGTRIAGLVKRVFVFSLITSALRGVRTMIGNVIKTNSEAANSIAQLKGALLTLAQPIVSVVIPAFTALINILAKLIGIIASVVSRFFGTTAKASAESAESLYKEQSAINGVGSAAKKASKQLAAFDEVNKIGDEDSSGGGGGGGGGSILPDFSALKNENWLSDTLGKAAGWVTAALLLGGIALIAIGACTGSLRLVLAGLLAIGAGLVIGEDTGVLESWVDKLGLSSVEGFVTSGLLLGGIALIAIGAATANVLLVLAGLVLLGAGVAYGKTEGVIDSWVKKLGLESVGEFVSIALLLGGIALIAIGACTGNLLVVIAGLGLLGAGGYEAYKSGSLKKWAETLGLDDVVDYVTAAMQLAGIALIAIGAAMGNIIMVIAGAALLVTGAIAQSVGEETLRKWWDALRLTTVSQWVSVALLLGGIVLVAIGAAMANILMVLAGLGIFAAGVFAAANEGTLKDWVTVLGLQKVMGWVTAGLLLGGIALVVIGIVTANIPLVLAGLGLLGAGIAVGITSGTFSSWLDTISNAFISFKNTMVETFNELWDKVKGAINGILGGIEGLANGAINGINTVIRAMNGLRFDIPNWVPGLGGKSFGFNIPTLKSVSIPRLATGAVIPPNREFLAVLGDQKRGTNIEAPASLIKQMVMEALGEAGGAGREINVTVVTTLDGKVVARNTVKHINDMTRQAGKPVLVF